MYLGMSRYGAPGTYTLLPYIEISDGIWYPKGPFQRVIWLLLRSLFHFVDLNIGLAGRQCSGPSSGSEVSPRYLGEEDWTVSDWWSCCRRTTGVRTSASGRFIAINADLVYAYSKLLPSSRHSQALQRRSTACSSISFY
jgi:phytoene desaturase (3,4-didehydrolycopene-forming)